MSAFKDSIIFNNAYKLVPLLVLGVGLTKGIGKGKSLFNFSYAVSVQSELNNYARRLSTDALSGENIPGPDGFADWLRGNFRQARDVHRDPAIDMWGTPYLLRVEAGTARIISAGPDKQYDTADDLVADVNLARP